jgi:hypothetical protein
MIISEYDTVKYNFNDIILDLYNKYFNTTINHLDNLHYLLDSTLLSKETNDYYKKIPLFGINDRSSEFIKCFYQFYDTNEMLNLKYLDFMKHIKNKFYPEEEFLVIQKTPNLRVHFPNCSNIGKLDTDPNDTIIGLHNDMMFGHPTTEINIIIAITNMYDTNSIYVEPLENFNHDDPLESFNRDESLDNVNDYKPLILKNNNICLLKLNLLKHYNKINITKKTRVSFDTRIIPYSMYKDSKLTTATTNTKFSIGHYYIKI